jgi:hypothetical protein
MSFHTASNQLDWHKDHLPTAIFTQKIYLIVLHTHSLTLKAPQGAQNRKLYQILVKPDINAPCRAYQVVRMAFQVNVTYQVAIGRCVHALGLAHHNDDGNIAKKSNQEDNDMDDRRHNSELQR